VKKATEAAEHAGRRSPPHAKRPAAPPKPRGRLGAIDLDEGPDAPPIAEQLAAALRENATRVMDLFRSWDANGDGQVSRAEFHRAMPALGLEVPKETIDELFSQWDVDGGGELGYKELRKILAQSSKPLAPKATPSTAPSSPPKESMSSMRENAPIIKKASAATMAVARLKR